jgi:hypothetical protein
MDIGVVAVEQPMRLVTWFLLVEVVAETTITAVVVLVDFVQLLQQVVVGQQLKPL